MCAGRPSRQLDEKIASRTNDVLRFYIKSLVYVSSARAAVVRATSGRRTQSPTAPHSAFIWAERQKNTPFRAPASNQIFTL